MKIFIRKEKEPKRYVFLKNGSDIDTITILFLCKIITVICRYLVVNNRGIITTAAPHITLSKYVNFYSVEKILITKFFLLVAPSVLKYYQTLIHNFYVFAKKKAKQLEK